MHGADGPDLPTRLRSLNVRMYCVERFAWNSKVSDGSTIAMN